MADLIGYLERMVDRTWLISLTLVPLYAVLALLVRRSLLRPATAHALALGLCLATLVPLLLPIRRHLFVLPGDDPTVVAYPTAWWTSFPLPWWSALIPAALLLGVAVLGSMRFRRGLAALEPVPQDVAHRVNRLARELGLSRAPEAAWGPEVNGPFALGGVGRERLILPPESWSRWSDEERDLVLLHELAHLRRRDGRAQLVTQVASAIFWWNPCVWWLRAAARDAAERACDRWTTALRAGGREAYARLLLDLAARRSRTPEGLGVSPASSAGRRLGSRLRAILGENRSPLAGLHLALPVLALILLGLGLSRGQIGIFEQHHVFDEPGQLAAYLREEPEAQLRRRAVDAAGNRGPRAAPWALPLLAGHFHHEPSASVRYEILDAAQRLGAGATHPVPEALRRGLEDPVPRVRRRAEDLLGP